MNAVVDFPCLGDPEKAAFIFTHIAVRVLSIIQFALQNVLFFVLFIVQQIAVGLVSRSETSLGTGSQPLDHPSGAHSHGTRCAHTEGRVTGLC